MWLTGPALLFRRQLVVVSDGVNATLTEEAGPVAVAAPNFNQRPEVLQYLREEETHTP